MRRVLHVLDTSALLAHYFGEAGSDQVQRVLCDPSVRPAMCAVTIPELRGRLSVELGDTTDTSEAVSAYVDELTLTLVVDRFVAEAAAQIRCVGGTRIPLVDAVIAGCARVHSAVLVRRDRHMGMVPQAVVPQLVLPEA